VSHAQPAYQMKIDHIASTHPGLSYHDRDDYFP